MTGRKRAPQPLALEGTDLMGESTSPGAALPSPNSSALGDAQRWSPRSPTTADPTLQVADKPSAKSPRSPRSPFSRFNPNRKQDQQSQQQQQQQQHQQQPPHQPSPQPPTQQPPQPDIEYPPMSPTFPQSQTTPAVQQESYAQGEEEKQARGAGRFFHFSKASKSAQQLPLQSPDGEAMSRGTDYPAMSDRVPSKGSKHSADVSSADPNAANSRHIPSQPSRSEISLASATEHEPSAAPGKKNKPKPFTLLNRNRSFKDQDGHSPKESAPTMRIAEPERVHTMAGQQPLRTAPVNPEGQERSFRHMMNSTVRNHSADRALDRSNTHNINNGGSSNLRPGQEPSRSNPSSYRDNSGTFFSGLKSSGTKAADMISKGLFGKGGRSGSTHEREHVVDDEHYQLKVINRPLVEQTRMTRISKRLEESRDKTEFWMPAFPWRAIDYLNYKGSDVEGLYRVPGSGPQIKKWQRKFDEELDVDLFAQDDLYDINIIGSMLKAWLRELPDELFPKEAQERIARECSGTDEVPQLLIDELSNLSPFNYYLLFAITCHLSLLLAHSDKNKMDFRNLCICFQPCMKIDAYCFKFLVCDWRACWQGCKNEAKFIEEEYSRFDSPPPKVGASDGNSRTRHGDDDGFVDERNLSSSDSGKQSAPSFPRENGGKLRKKPIPGQSNGSVASNDSAISTSIGGESARDRDYRDMRSTPPPRISNELRPLSPIKPLSPLDFH